MPAKKLAAVLAVMCVVLVGCATDPTPGPDDRISGWTPPVSSSASTNPSECEYVQTGEASRPVELPTMSNVAHTGTVNWTLNTNEGPLVLTLDRQLAPCAVNSFESLAKQKFFDNTACHRLADSGIFVLQCGDPTGTGSGGPGYQFADEVTPNTRYPAGTVAMANSGEDTNGSQFFLVYADSDLPPNYTVFGHFGVEGQALLGRIAAEGHDNSYGDGTGKPANPSQILTVIQGGDPGPAIPTPGSSGR